MTTEVVISPVDETVRVNLADAPAWRTYSRELRRTLGEVLTRAAVGSLEIDRLLVNRPLPGRYSTIRNGRELGVAEAIELVEHMAAGYDPYCRLRSENRIRIEAGWDGSVHLYVEPTIADQLTLRPSTAMIIRDRVVEDDREEAMGAPLEVANGDFWEQVRALLDRVILLCERWAYGTPWL